MIKKKKVLANVISLMLLALSVVSFIPSFVSFETLISDTNYVIFSGLIVLSAFFVFFLTKNIDVNGKGEKVFSVFMIFTYFLVAFFGFIFFRNSTDSSFLLYRKIKTLLPYLFILSQYYSCDSIKEENRRFTMMIYLSSAYFLIGFLTLDLDGIILVAIADLIYTLIKCKKHLLKTIAFIAVAAFIVVTFELSFDFWTKYLNENSSHIFKNNNTVELFQYATLLPSNHQYTGTNYLISLTNSFGLVGLITATALFVLLMVLSISEGVCVPYWIFMAVLYLLSFISLTSGVFNFEFYLFSPSLATIALNAIVFGVVTNKKGI